ncbi:MAG: hypothetical protein ACRD1X_17990 [Vicinamibacteria bacterium]
MAFGDAQSILSRLEAVARARRSGNQRALAALAIDAQDAMTWGVAQNLISIAEFNKAKANLRRLVGS